MFNCHQNNQHLHYQRMENVTTFYSHLVLTTSRICSLHILLNSKIHLRSGAV
jgi:hypothetical protein